MDHAAVLGSLDSVLWIITSAAGDRRGGLVATNVMSISIVPDRPRMITGLALTHFTQELLSASGSCVLHLIDESQIDWVRRFAAQKGRDTDKLEGLNIVPTAGGAPRLADALGFLECRVETSWDLGDRRLFLLEVLSGGRRDGTTPALQTSRMIELAPPELKAALKADLEADIAPQRAAIDQWRSTHTA